MNILHICLFSSYTEEMGYQENMLAAAHNRDGNNVTIISNCSFFENGILKNTIPEDKITKSGIRLIRVPFIFNYLGIIARKIGKTKDMKKILMNLEPNIIIYHGAQGFDLLTIANYVKKHKDVKFFIDTHADYNNSSRNILNKINNRFIQKNILRKILIYVSKVFFVSIECGSFASRELCIPESKLEFLPLGGFPVNPEHKDLIRKKIRAEYNISNNNIVFIHSGKFNKDKKTEDLIKAFSCSLSKDINLILVGVFEDDLEINILNKIKEDERIIFMGWKNVEDLKNLIIASDCYLQPGSQSATLQLAICCGISVLIYPYESHRPFLVNNGYFVSDLTSMKEKIDFLSNNKPLLVEMSKASLKLANEILDYNIIASRFYRE